MSLLQSRLNFHPRSHVAADGAEFALAQTEAGPRLAVLAIPGSSVQADFEGETAEQADGVLLFGPTSAANAAALRRHLSWLQPQPLGLSTSAGMGDRLGLATPGHVRAMRAVGGDIAPIFAQQSIREMARTGRTAQQVMDDATWGIFQEGWQGGIGADADHLKTKSDIDVGVAAGFSFFTIDPGEHVDSAADTAAEATIRGRYAVLPWPDLGTTAAGLRVAYVGKRIEVEDRTIAFDEETLLRAAVKYARAVAHVARLYRHLTAGPHPTHPRQTTGEGVGGWGVELEVSVDETDTPTSHAEHVFIARELRRLGVKWVSLAPRYVGRFEKGVDYIGDLAEFERDFAGHAAIARSLGPYKLSLHSGSDKFSVYPIAAQQARGLVHLKTAGTSYLEALRTVAQVDSLLFREIYIFAREHYETDRASYHVSAQLAVAPLPGNLTDAALPILLEQFDAREILHVTFGSVLRELRPDGRPRFYDRLMALLRANPEAYAANLERHFIRHLRPFAGTW